jgi:transcriptional regulator with XRE-family HTH domain
MNMKREKAIGARLRAFREKLQIPRTKFAVAIGFGGERMAAYESGRARMPYIVFKAIANRYDLYPRWLAEGEGAPQVKNSFNDEAFAPGLARHALFTAVYDRYLAKQLKGTAGPAGADMGEAIENLHRTSALLQTVDTRALTGPQRKKIAQFNRLQGKLLQSIQQELGLRESINTRAAQLAGKAKR